MPIGVGQPKDNTINRTNVAKTIIIFWFVSFIGFFGSVSLPESVRMSPMCQRALPLSVSVLELVCTAIYVIGKRVEQSAARVARPYMVNDLLAERHPHVVLARRAFGFHRALTSANTSFYLRCTLTRR